MKILILGGTKFVGRSCAEIAVSRGHEVTVFNRGNRSGPPGVRELVGDRLDPHGYSSLQGLEFDTVIDTWHSDNEAVKTAVDALRGRIGHFIYVSSIIVYRAEGAARPITEASEVWNIDKSKEPYSENPYTVAKVGGEIHASASGVPTLLARPGIILGPLEGLGGEPARLPWWLKRMRRGGKTLAPRPPDLSTQFIDVRDLANFLIDAAEKKLQGPVNLVSEQNHMTFGDFLETSNRVAGSHAELCWLDEDKVLESGISPWWELPVWMPKSAKGPAIYSNDVSKAIGLGLKIRPGRETIADTWSWMERSGDTSEDGGSKIGLDPEKEAAILRRYFGEG